MVQKGISQWLNDLPDITPEEHNYLLTPHHVHHAKIRYDSEQKAVDAWRIQFNRDRGPGKGGIRYHPDVNEEEVQDLAFWMALKNSLANLPYGGAKGGVAINPKQLTNPQLQTLSRNYVKAFADNIGTDKDIPAPDVYTTPEIMAWMLDEYEQIKGRHEPSMITGKPLEVGGSKARNIATALGAYYIIKAEETHPKKIIIHGYGNAGKTLAELLKTTDHIITGVSDSTGAIHNENGLYIDEVSEAKKNEGTITAYADAEKLSNDALLQQPCDILIPAAIENTLTAKNAKKIRAETVYEVANGPTTYDAEDMLDATIYPDILVNSGGVIVSYFEWVQGRTGHYWKEERVKNTLKQKILTSLSEVKSAAAQQKVTLRIAAYHIATQRILRAARLRGRL